MPTDGPNWRDCADRQAACQAGIHKKLDDHKQALDAQHRETLTELGAIKTTLAEQKGAREAIERLESREEIPAVKRSGLRLPTVGEVVKVGVFVGAILAGAIGGCEGAKLALQRPPAVGAEAGP